MNKREYTFTLSKSFKGFKRFNIVQHGIDGAEENCRYLSQNGIKDNQIIFQENISKNGQPYVCVIVDNKLIGAIFDAEQINSLRSGSISAAHVHFETESVVSSGKTEERDRVRVFVRYGA